MKNVIIMRTLVLWRKLRFVARGQVSMNDAKWEGESSKPITNMRKGYKQTMTIKKNITYSIRVEKRPSCNVEKEEM
jgi:hypothetical protein